MEQQIITNKALDSQEKRKLSEQQCNYNIKKIEIYNRFSNFIIIILASRQTKQIKNN